MNAKKKVQKYFGSEVVSPEMNSFVLVHGDRLESSLLSHEDRFHALDYSNEGQPSSPKDIVTQW